MHADLDLLQTVIQHRFRNPELLRRALTHSSHAYETFLADSPAADARGLDNEQLEFLGDSVLGFLVSDALFRVFPSFPEGKLSKLRAHLVSAEHLHEVALSLDLGRFLHLGRGEEMSGGRLKKTLLVDSLEALIAALYLDGGLDTARDFVDQCIFCKAAGIAGMFEAAAVPLADFKSALQEFVQGRKLPPPHYSVLETHGPEHSKTFTVEVRVGGEWSAKAEGRSKKSAAQKAAGDLLRRITVEWPPSAGTPPESAA